VIKLLLALCVGVGLCLRFANPAMTQVEFALAYWPYMVIAFILMAAVALIESD
jgi:hypothetical protein